MQGHGCMAKACLRAIHRPACMPTTRALHDCHGSLHRPPGAQARSAAWRAAWPWAFWMSRTLGPLSGPSRRATQATATCAWGPSVRAVTSSRPPTWGEHRD